MYRVGVCDDGMNICSVIEEAILKYSQRNNIRLDVETWNTGEGLQQYLQEGNDLDILFLDIELLEMNGIEVADYIRNQLENRSMQIIFISAKSSYAQSLFKVQPMDFLVKPIQQEQIEGVLNLAIKLLSRSNSRFEFRVGKDYYYVPYGEIMYFSSMGRMVEIVCYEKQIQKKETVSRKYIEDDEVHTEKKFYGKLKDIVESLPANYIMIHQSYIVNTDYIAKYTYELIRLIDGTELPISKPNRKLVRQRLLREE